MKKAIIRCFLFFCGTILLLQRLVVISAQSETPVLPPTPTIAPTVATMQAQVESLNTEVINLKKDMPQKDIWDKLAAISGLLSGILVASIGGFATYTYNERKREADQLHNERELAIQRIQTVHNFMAQLQSNDDRAIEAAILSISTLDIKLATELASLFRVPGSVTALSKMMSSTNPDVAKQAEESLDKLFHSLHSAIVMIMDSESHQLRQTGFLVSSSGYIFTPDYLNPQDVYVKWRDKIYSIQSIKRIEEANVIILKIDGDSFPFLEIPSITKVKYQEKVFALIYDNDFGWVLSSGQIINYDVSVPDIETQSLIIADLEVPLGSGGVPVVNAGGQIIGVIYAIGLDRKGAVLIPASQIYSLVDEIRNTEKL